LYPSPEPTIQPACPPTTEGEGDSQSNHLNKLFRALRKRAELVISLLILIAAILVLFNGLMKDPSIYKRFGDVGDEGYWVASAKNLHFFGSYLSRADNNTQAFVGAPLYSFLLYVLYTAFGSGLAIARSLSAVCAILIISFICASPLSLRARIIASLSLLLSVTFQSYSKWATPVLLQSLLEFLTIFTLCHANDRRSRRYAFIAGILCVAVVGAKLSGYIFFPAALCLVLYLAWASKSLTGVKFFASGLLVGVLALAAYYAYFRKDLLLFFAALGKLNSPLRQDFPYFKPSFGFLLAFPKDPITWCFFSFSLLSLVVFAVIALEKRIVKFDAPSIYFGIPIWLSVVFLELLLIADKADRRVFLLLLPAVLFFSMLSDSRFYRSCNIFSTNLFQRLVQFVVVVAFASGLYTTVNSIRMQTSFYAMSTSQLAQIVNKQDCLDGVLAHWYAANTSVTPVWYGKEAGYARFNSNIDGLNFAKCRNYYVILGKFEGADLSDAYRSEAELRAYKKQEVMRLFIPPAQGRSVPRFEGLLYRVFPE
jgi:hypothetical protein